MTQIPQHVAEAAADELQSTRLTSMRATVDRYEYEIGRKLTPDELEQLRGVALGVWADRVSTALRTIADSMAEMILRAVEQLPSLFERIQHLQRDAVAAQQATATSPARRLDIATLTPTSARFPGAGGVSTPGQLDDEPVYEGKVSPAVAERIGAGMVRGVSISPLGSLINSVDGMSAEARAELHRQIDAKAAAIHAEIAPHQRGAMRDADLQAALRRRSEMR